MIETLIAFVLLLSVLIFVHELGHFLAAKACGVRVLKFSLGFGSPIGFGRYRLRWRRGETEYVAAWFPLGGFVKMLGENPDEQDDPEVRAHPSETLAAQPLWQKLFIVFAGPVMNLLLPVLIFSLLLWVGVPKEDAVIGSVEPRSPAAEAGLAPGDRVLAVDGGSVRWWSDVARALDRPGEGERRLAIERDGRERTVVLPALDAEAGPGVQAAGLGHARPRALVAVIAPDAPARAAGLRSGDLVVALDGEPVEDWHGLRVAYAAARGEVLLEVLRAGEAEPRPLRAPALGDLGALGVTRATALVAEVEPDSPAARAGLRGGDVILAVDGEPVLRFADFAATVAGSQGRPLALRVARGAERLEVSLAAEPILTDTGFGIDETRYRIGIRGGEALTVGAVAIQRERNPLVAVPAAVGMTWDFTRLFMGGLAQIVTGEVSTKSLAGPIGIAQIAGTAFQKGWDHYLRIMVLISINLGILNLLPIPVLDGGQALLFLVEGARRSPLPLRTKLAVQQFGVTVLVLLMGLAFWNDLSRLWTKVVDWLPPGS